MTFNPAELATYEEARQLRTFLNSTQAFKNNPILPGDDEAAAPPVANPNFPWLPPLTPQVGIYLPSWVSGPHADPEPAIGTSYFLHFRMSNGHLGFNVGLCREKFRSFPNSPDYVVSELAKEMI